jgi:ATP-dependent Clp protease adapter protein ClpS
MSTELAPEIQERENVEQESEWMLPRKVVVHNCECHTFHQVINALMKSLPMSYEDAESFATLVHLTGAAVVYEGDLEKCELIANSIIAWAGPGGKGGHPLKVTVEE